MKSLSWVVDRKVWIGGLAGFITALVVYLASRFGLEIPLGFIAAMPVVINSAIAYLVPQAVRDVVSRVNNKIVELATEDPENPTTAVVVPAAVVSSHKAMSAAISAGMKAINEERMKL